jgi:hypothetical protein
MLFSPSVLSLFPIGICIPVFFFIHQVHGSSGVLWTLKLGLGRDSEWEWGRGVGFGGLFSVSFLGAS